MEVVDRILRAVHVVVDDERLAFAPQTRFGNDVDDSAEFVEEAVERVFEIRDLDLFVEVLNVDAVSVISIGS